MTHLYKIVSFSNVSPKNYKDFTCGKKELDEYLHRYAKTNDKKGIGKTFVIVESSRVIGYYTISMGSIEFSSIPLKLQSGLPKYPIPVARIGRLAVDSSWQKKGIGKLLLIDALKRILGATQAIAAYAIVVDAKDNKAKAFYEHFGFISYQDKDLALFLPINTIETMML